MPRRPQKRTAERRRQRPQSPIAIDPLVGPGDPPHRHPSCAKTDQPRSRHCMVHLATRTSSHRSKSSYQAKYATVMLGHPSSQPRAHPQSVGQTTNLCLVSDDRERVLAAVAIVAADEGRRSPCIARRLSRHSLYELEFICLRPPVQYLEHIMRRLAVSPSREEEARMRISPLSRLAVAAALAGSLAAPVAVRAKDQGIPVM